MIIRHKHITLLDSKPGAVSGSTKIIFVKMICRIGNFNEQSTTYAVCGLRNKFNDALNDAVAKIGQYILTINSCSAYEDFKKKEICQIEANTHFGLRSMILCKDSKQVKSSSCQIRRIHHIARRPADIINQHTINAEVLMHPLSHQLINIMRNTSLSTGTRPHQRIIPIINIFAYWIEHHLLFYFITSYLSTHIGTII